MNNSEKFNERPLIEPQASIPYKTQAHPGVNHPAWLWDLLLILVILAGAFFRFTGVNWDENHHLHPDERFLTMVETSIAPVGNLSEYFNTSISTLNPNNRGYGFYVYGTLPLFIVRYAGEWLNQTGYDQIHIVGRQLSALMDLGTVFIVFLIAVRMYGSRRLGLIASAFAACMVLPIQLSHYFTVDTFTNFFGMLAFYYAIRLLPERQASRNIEVKQTGKLTDDPWTAWIYQDWGSVSVFIFFGVALGMAMASKINAVMLAVLLPAAVILRYLHMPSSERGRLIGIYLRNMVVAGLVCLVVFRIFQPYAFSGPGFFGIKPNQAWIDSLRALASQSTGDVDFPPALQWARRPIWFAFQHMVLWGLGLPLGILAWGGFLWMGYRIFIGRERQHLIIWSWTGIYFLYQSFNWTRSMRYQMLIYPTLAIIAAWAIWALWQRSRNSKGSGWRIASVGIGLLAICLTFAWAYAFTRIYARPMTRVEASRWIYQNVPGPINIHIENAGVTTNQPIAFKNGFTLLGDDEPFVLALKPTWEGELTEIYFEHLVNPNYDESPINLRATISLSPDSNVIASGHLAGEFRAESDPRGKSYSLTFDDMVLLSPDQVYYLTFSLDGLLDNLNIAGPVMAVIYNDDGYHRQALPEPVDALQAGKIYRNTFTASTTGKINEITLNRVVDWEGRSEAKTLRISILDDDNIDKVLSSAEITDAFESKVDPRGEEYTFRFTQPIEVRGQSRYTLQVEQVDGPGRLAIYGSKQANESSWDDALPVPLDGYNAYDYSFGIYRSDLNFEMYWDDNLDKLNRFTTTLDQADYIFISSNRQWGTTTRLPERYPLTSEYYRQLLGCPAKKEITWCYSVAEPGMFTGKLGFELQAVFQSDPSLGNFRFNTQFAEEAFTVYDHPKVLIFRKTRDYSPERVSEILKAVDLNTVVHVTPRKAESYPGNLLLPLNRLAEQRSGGTWSHLFNNQSWINRFPVLTVLAWYLVISITGWIVFPFVRLGLGGLADRGFPQLRMVGMLALALPVWLLGSYRIPFQSSTITFVFLFLILINLILGYIQRKNLMNDFRRKWKYYLLIEAVAFAFFLLFLFVRIGNPDLWHPWKGGEKPMDFSYFNAVLKSTTFPPYDPWFAGGYINYYYYGFVLVGVPVKWLGIVPSVAYNLILPTLFSMLAMAAFSIGWNLISATMSAQSRSHNKPSFINVDDYHFRARWFAGFGSTVAVVILGNWGSVRMIWHGLQKLADMKVPFEEASLLQRVWWTFQGLARLISSQGLRLPYGNGDWYWIPSRAIPGEPITEFPAFTFLYADLHAHMIALPITLLALSWSLSILFQHWQWKNAIQIASCFLIGGLAIGALRPTNTWDWPAYLAFGCLSIIFTAVRYSGSYPLHFPKFTGPIINRFIQACFGVFTLIILSEILYHPFTTWYAQAYNKVDFWEGARTPFWSYLTHWGVFLFVITSWLISEVLAWMASTPVSALNHLQRFRELIIFAIILFVCVAIGMTIMGIPTAWLVLFLAALSGLLLLRPGQPDAKRAVLMMVGTALILTLFVEVAVLQGDIGRMNTVFKFYLQAWSLFALSAGASLFWVIPSITTQDRSILTRIWNIALAVSIVGALLFPLLAGADKISDRMTRSAAHSLDGMDYMAVSKYTEGDKEMDLSEDYQAIRWIQQNIPGSPVILEANVPEYRWGNRFTIYTGLPSVVGWNWHQRQQRAITPGEWVFTRVEDITNFYNTENIEQALGILRRYDVQYIIVGQLERAVYAPAGLMKFDAQNGIVWQRIYQNGQTSIYQVVQ